MPPEEEGFAASHPSPLHLKELSPQQEQFLEDGARFIARPPPSKNCCPSPKEFPSPLQGSNSLAGRGNSLRREMNPHGDKGMGGGGISNYSFMLDIATFLGTRLEEVRVDSPSV